MHNLAPVLENDMHKLQWDFNIQTDNLIRICCPGRPQNKSEGMCKEG